ncbi:RNB domain-containing ribonuclease [Microbacterium sp.]|uniref:RNB domain-containing ribonuclease n=1 Tax=Microbacterium sp. TaxID=51671 RepID=UPI00261508C1|nr:RNB domain-containing ribonuclease [Microbacterium sp.]MCV0333348.1 RNB domain-containing ribonuclease [Microbacterium sp.]MCV0375793.1 RNB domain-containing ribonuclease [Microbacterium sp.]MCV0388852.1 RNB domain-containing ribonuclease [Microbacterium sp.]MCV0417380.1 RNB domain-containing ribonuclease [Microbacterium sp.]MCV0420691.1 RNB domain-containing ribonuclease [Microbacterium sp.]
MPQRRSHVAPSAAQTELASALAGLRESVDAPLDFPDEVIAEAEASTAPVPQIDLRDVPFATLDPEGSRDLDQAFHLERAGTGYTVRYAIADVPGFVAPGGTVDAEARRRGQTLYAADGSIPLHPRVLSEDRASLLADVDRPALVWTFALDSSGVVSDFRLERALIRSRAQLDYATTQLVIDRGEDGPAALLPEIGALRMEQERLRGGASLNLPDEEVVRAEDGTYAIERRRPLPVEEWNAQLSLMTGMAAASLMLDAGVGIFRTMPEPDAAAFETFRHQTEALGRPWTAGAYGDYLRGLDRADPMTLPVLEAASSLFRGAGYLVFDGEAPDTAVQAAIAAPYAHATAPLRRLVDRWALAICLAAANGEPAPEWARASLGELPALMQESGQRASRLNAATINSVEAALLTPLVGTTIEATVIELRGERAAVQIADPAVTATAPLPPGAQPGDVVRLRIVRADIAKGEVEFAI